MAFIKTSTKTISLSLIFCFSFFSFVFAETSEIEQIENKINQHFNGLVSYEKSDGDLQTEKVNLSYIEDNSTELKSPTTTYLHNEFAARFSVTETDTLDVLSESKPVIREEELSPISKNELDGFYYENEQKESGLVNIYHQINLMLQYLESKDLDVLDVSRLEPPFISQIENVIHMQNMESNELIPLFEPTPSTTTLVFYGSEATNQVAIFYKTTVLVLHNYLSQANGELSFQDNEIVCAIAYYLALKAATYYQQYPVTKYMNSSNSLEELNSLANWNYSNDPATIGQFISNVMHWVNRIVRFEGYISEEKNIKVVGHCPISYVGNNGLESLRESIIEQYDYFYGLWEF